MAEHTLLVKSNAQVRKCSLINLIARLQCQMAKRACLMFTERHKKLGSRLLLFGQTFTFILLTIHQLISCIVIYKEGKRKVI